MKTIFISLILILLFACQTKTKKTSETQKDEKLVQTISKSVSKKEDVPEIVYSTEEYFQKIYSDEKMFYIKDENMILSIGDSLFSKDSSKQEYYFTVFSKSMNGSDGFYSEMVSLCAYKFVTVESQKFINYFRHSNKLTEQDLDNWALFVLGEIQIEYDTEIKKGVKELQNKLEKNVPKSNKQNPITKLIKKIKKLSLGM
jgi:hypothetical protein